MIQKKNNLITLDNFINKELYHKQTGYYMSSEPFGKKGDFITSPGISVLFSEMIAIWIISFWEYLGCPQKFNLVELGAGNGEMMKILISTFNKFPKLKAACKIHILEKSNFLKKIQKKTINSKNILWLKDLKKLNSSPTIFIANEFFDALPIKQFIKKKNKWHERYVEHNVKKKEKFVDVLFDMKKFEKKINLKISKNQSFIEYSPTTMNYLKTILKKIKSNNGGILIIDYGYLDTKIKNTLQSVKNHKFCDILNNFGKSDITYNINFNLLKKIVNKFQTLNSIITNQKKFLLNLGILKRAEIVSKNLSFSKKADIFYRIKRLTDSNGMGDLFKVMFVTKKKNKFNVGF